MRRAQKPEPEHLPDARITFHGIEADVELIEDKLHECAAHRGMELSVMASGRVVFFARRSRQRAPRASGTIGAMRRFALMVGFAVTVLALFAGTASAKLSPAEQKWIHPLLTLFNAVDANLRVVIKEELAPDALVGQSGKNFATLNATLVVFANCPSAVSAAGSPPTTRLEPFDADMKSACAHIQAGALDVGHAIGEVDEGNGAPARAALEAATAEFSDGSDLLAAALHRLTVVSGGSA